MIHETPSSVISFPEMILISLQILFRVNQLADLSIPFEIVQIRIHLPPLILHQKPHFAVLPNILTPIQPIIPPQIPLQIQINLIILIKIHFIPPTKLIPKPQIIFPSISLTLSTLAQF